MYQFTLQHSLVAVVPGHVWMAGLVALDGLLKKNADELLKISQLNENGKL